MDMEIEARVLDIVAEQVMLLGLFDRVQEQRAQMAVFLPQVNVAVLRVDRVAANRDRFN